MNKLDELEDVGMTVEEMMQRLPQVFLDSEAISDAAKKVMAALFHLFVTNEQAQRTGDIVCPNHRLRGITSIGQNQMRDAVNELKEYSLIERKPGKTWEKGKQKEASTYRIKFDALTQPIKKKTFDDYRHLWENLTTNHIEEQTPPQPILMEEPRHTRPTITIEQPSDLEDILDKADNATTTDDLERLKGYMYCTLQKHIKEHGLVGNEITELYNHAEERFEKAMNKFQVTSLKAVQHP